MKKLLCLLLAMVMVLGLAACGKEEEETKAPETEAVTEAASEDETEPADTEEATEPAESDEGESFVFKHGFDLDYPPYSYIQEDGSMGGFDVEVCQAVCEYLGWGYEAVPFNWDSKDAELNAHSCDCIWSGLTYEGREDEYTWSDPYSNNAQMILVAEDSGIETLEDLAGKAVGVQTATSAYDLLQGDQKALADTFGSLEVYETYTIAFNDLKAGAIDAISIDITAGSFLISDETGFKFLDESIGDEHYAIGFRLGDEELRDQVNQALYDLAENGTIERIAENPDYAEIRTQLTIID